MPPKASENLFEVRQSPVQGHGVFATQCIPKGTRIVEYVGERISHEVADERYDDVSMDRHHTFLFTVDKRMVIDAAVGGNEARFINHSCDPNCEPILEGKRIFIYSLRTIDAGEELAYDYRYERTGAWTAEDLARYPCYCGAANCRGTILRLPAKKKRPAAAKKKSSAAAAKKKSPAAATKKKSSAAKKPAGPSRGPARAKKAPKRA